jgi:hypothetical protein
MLLFWLEDNVCLTIKECQGQAENELIDDALVVIMQQAPFYSQEV